MTNNFKKTEQEIVQLTGTAMFASVQAPRTSVFKGIEKVAYEIDLVVNDAATLALLKGVGAKPRKTEDGELRAYEDFPGKVFKLSTKFKPTVVDAQLNETTALIGNGSTITVEASVYRGVSTMLNPLTVRIDKLVEYVKAEAAERPARQTTLKPLTTDAF